MLDGEAAVLVLSGDVPLVSAEALRELLDAHSAGGAAATMATTVLADPSGYGRVVRDADGAVERVVETKSQGDSTQAEREIREVNTGIFVFQAGPLRGALPRLDSENAQGELYLPQVLEVLHADGAGVAGHEIDDPRLVLGVNDRAALAEVRAVAQRAIHRRHMLAGVTIVDPAATVIDVDVEIGQDTVIEPFTSIRGRRSIGARVPHPALLPRRLRARGRRHRRPVRLSAARARCCGPAPRSAPTSRSRTPTSARSSKIPHLSYIGDADVGARTNLGAATITANYDGRAKHRTTVGDDVRTSVDTTLVAPVTSATAPTRGPAR